MDTYRVTLAYDRRSHKCPMFEVDVQASCAMEAKSLGRQHALKVFSKECPIRVNAEKLKETTT